MKANADVKQRPAVTVQRLLLRAFDRYSSNDCLAFEGGTASFAATAERVRGLARYLQAQTPREAHVAILMPNGREFLELILACAAAARVRVPIGDREPAAAVAAKIAKAECHLVFTTAEWLEQLRELMGEDLPPVVVVGAGAGGEAAYEEVIAAGSRGSDLWLCLGDERYRLSFTGGTTGAAKAVVETHRQELALIRNLLMEAFDPGPGKVFVAATPLSHASGAFVLPTVLKGGCLSWTEGFKADRLTESAWLGERTKVQTFVVPTALDDLANSAAGVDHALDTVVYGGAPCPQPVAERALDAIGPRLVQVYGQAEAAMTICVLPKADHGDPADFSGCSGYPFFFVDIALEDAEGNRLEGTDQVGEVVVYSDHVMEEYWQEPELTRERFSETGGLKTQDLGRWDEQGRLWLVGRSREMFISGGYNIFPAEVERRLGKVDGAKDLAAFGVNHPRWGEAMVLAVVPGDGAADGDRLREQIEQISRDRLASYERPKSVVIVEDLPLTSVGKVSRAGLTERFEKMFDSDQ